MLRIGHFVVIEAGAVRLIEDDKRLKSCFEGVQCFLARL